MLRVPLSRSATNEDRSQRVDGLAAAPPTQDRLVYSCFVPDLTGFTKRLLGRVRSAALVSVSGSAAILKGLRSMSAFSGLQGTIQLPHTSLRPES